MALSAVIRPMGQKDVSKQAEARRAEGEKLRTWRRFLDLTQQELADRLEVNVMTFAAYEQGRAAVPDRLKSKLRLLGFGSEPSNAKIEKSHSMVSGFALMVAIRSWRGVLAGFGDEESDFEEDGFYETPRAFLTVSEDFDKFEIIRIAGQSMSPRINSGDRVIIYRDPVPIPNTIVLATSPEGKVYLKALRQHNGKLILESLSTRGDSFKDLTGWSIHGYAIAVWKGSEHEEGPNIEYRFGRPLKA